MADVNTYGGSFYAATMADVPERRSLNIELDVDVCVIGGGLAGLTVAREVARRGWSVGVLEAKRIAWNASGRNTGFVLPGFAAEPEAIITRVGNEQARLLWSLAEAGADYVRNTIAETKMPGADLVEGGWLQISKTDNAQAMIDRADLLAQEFGADVEFWPAERVRAELKSPRYFGAIYFRRGFSIHPLNYALGLAAAAEAAGARIFEETPAIEIDPAGVRKRITTPSARVRASHVVLAGNMHIGALMPQLAATLVPISTYIITTAPLGDALRESITFKGAVSDGELADNHYRVVGGDRLMWSGRCTLWEGNPRGYIKTLLGDIARAFPQLGKVEAEYAWTGMLGNTVHRMPQIGELSSGLWLLSGFGGHGLNTTAMGGEIIARAIIDSDQTWRSFSPYELVWAGGRTGKATVQSYYWYFRTREQIAGFLARRKEASRAGKTGNGQANGDASSDAPSAVSAEAEMTADNTAESNDAKKTRRRRKKRKAAAAPDEPPAAENGGSEPSPPAEPGGSATPPDKPPTGGSS